MQAKIKTYLDALKSGKIKTDAQFILQYIKETPNVDIRDICRDLVMPIQTVSARVSDLLDLGLIKEIGQTKSNESTLTLLGFVELQAERDILIFERKKLKYKAWLKRGAAEYKDFMPIDLLLAINANV